jgi:hypothetical protein
MAYGHTELEPGLMEIVDIVSANNYEYTKIKQSLKRSNAILLSTDQKACLQLCISSTSGDLDFVKGDNLAAG